MDKVNIIMLDVKELLTKHPSLRGNDMRLMVNVWTRDILRQMGQVNIHHVSGSTVMAMIAEGKVSRPETIRRYRQQLQKDNEYLRDVNWEKRQSYNKRH